jgi:hypothetical protein
LGSKTFQYSKEYPGWFFEGAPSFFAAQVVDLMKISAYSVARDELIKVGTYGSYPRKSLDTYDQNVFPGTYIYGIGQVAIEYIVASAGFDSIMNIYKFIGDGDTFETAFRRSTGITLDVFYQNFTKIQDSVGIYD